MANCLTVSLYACCIFFFFQTYIGNMLLSINPFKPLTIYTEELRQKYQGNEQHRNPPWANTLLYLILLSLIIHIVITGSKCLWNNFIISSWVMLSVVLCLSHVYAIADTAFSQSQASSQEQCIIIRYWQIHRPHQFDGIFLWCLAKLCFFSFLPQV